MLKVNHENIELVIKEAAEKYNLVRWQDIYIKKNKAARMYAIKRLSDITKIDTLKYLGSFMNFNKGKI